MTNKLDIDSHIFANAAQFCRRDCTYSEIYVQNIKVKWALLFGTIPLASNTRKSNYISGMSNNREEELYVYIYTYILKPKMDQVYTGDIIFPLNTNCLVIECLNRDIFGIHSKFSECFT